MTSGSMRILDRDDREKVRAIASFPERFAVTGGAFPAFSDVRFGETADPLVVSTAGRMVFGLDAGFDTTRLIMHHGLVPILATLFRRPASIATPPLFPLDAGGFRGWFPQAGVAVYRPMDWIGGIGVAIKAGHNGEHHNHNDIGSFVIVRDGVALVTDPGGEEYTSRTFSDRRYESKVINSWGHPVPVVGGRLQGTGAHFIGAFASYGLGELTETLTIDMTRAYDLPTLRSLMRRVTYNRASGGTTTIIDDVAFTRPETFESAIITYGAWTRVDATTIRIDDGGRSVLIGIETNGEPFEITSETINEKTHKTRRPTRIGIRLKKAVGAGSIGLRFS